MAMLGDVAKGRTESLGDMLKDWRGGNGYTLTEAAEKTELLSPGRLEAIESGDPPSMYELVRLCETYKADMRELLNTGWPQLSSVWAHVPDTLVHSKEVNPQNIHWAWESLSIPAFVTECRRAHIFVPNALGAMSRNMPMKLSSTTRANGELRAIDLPFDLNAIRAQRDLVAKKIHPDHNFVLAARFGLSGAIAGDILLAIGALSNRDIPAFIAACYPGETRPLRFDHAAALTSPTEFGKAIAKVRKAQKLSQGALGHALGLDVGTGQVWVSRVETGATVPPLGMILKMEVVFSLPVGMLVSLVPWKARADALTKPIAKAKAAARVSALPTATNVPPPPDAPEIIGGNSKFVTYWWNLLLAQHEKTPIGNNGISLPKFLADNGLAKEHEIGVIRGLSSRLIKVGWESHRRHTNEIDPNHSIRLWFPPGTYTPLVMGRPAHKTKVRAAQEKAAVTETVKPKVKAAPPPPASPKAEAVTFIVTADALPGELIKLAGRKATFKPLDAIGVKGTLFMVTVDPID